MFNGEKNKIQLSLIINSIINLIINLLQLITMPTYVIENIFLWESLSQSDYHITSYNEHFFAADIPVN